MLLQARYTLADKVYNEVYNSLLLEHTREELEILIESKRRSSVAVRFSFPTFRRRTAACLIPQVLVVRRVGK